MEAADGQEAVQQLRTNGPFDLLVTDFAMPGMSGAQLGEAARVMDPALPILFVTGYAEGEALAAWENKGARMLDKPFTGAQMTRGDSGHAGAPAAARGLTCFSFVGRSPPLLSHGPK